MTMSYTMQDIDRIIHNGISFSLDPKTIHMIIDLEKMVKTKTISSSHKHTTVVKTWAKPSTFAMENDNSNLNNLLYTKPLFITEHKTTEYSVDETIKSVKTLLNKISSKNYDKQLALITEALDVVTLQEDVAMDFTKIFCALTDVMNNNVFLASINARVCADLIAKYPLLRLDADSASDLYEDDFVCSEKLSAVKSRTPFMVELCNEGVIEVQIFVGLIMTIPDMVSGTIDNASCIKLTEDRAEILHMIVAGLGQKIKKVAKNNWKSVCDPIYALAALKAKEHEGLSNKIVFKFKDVADLLKSF